MKAFCVNENLNNLQFIVRTPQTDVFMEGIDLQVARWMGFLLQCFHCYLCANSINDHRIKKPIFAIKLPSYAFESWVKIAKR